MVSTDIPAGEVAGLLELASAGRAHPLASTAFAPPLIEPSRPDIDLIRRTVAGEIAHSESLDIESRPQDAGAASPSPSGTPTAAPASTPPASAKPAQPTATAAADASVRPTAAPDASAGPKPVVGTKAEKSDGHFSEQRQTEDLAQVCGVA